MIKKDYSLLYKKYLSSIFVFLTFLVLIRLVEFVFLSKNLYFSYIQKSIIQAIGTDILFGGILCLICAIPFFFLRCNFVNIVFRILIFFFILITWILTQYYLTSGILLSNLLFSIEWEELKHIIENELTTNRLPYTICFIAFCLLSFFVLFVKPLKVNKFVSYLTIVILLLSLFSLKNTNKTIVQFDTEKEYWYVQNKIAFFLKTIREHSIETQLIEKADLKIYLEKHKTTGNYKFNYISNEYPFLHTTKYKNVLGTYFTKSETKPNIVILIVESLSAYFCGKNATIKNLMPFTYSLIDSSLYWSNFLSNCPQTFGALPNILASLPYGIGERGFINMENYPEHTSLVKILNNQGYYSSFFYSGWLPFDNIDKFTNYHNFKHIVSDTSIKSFNLRNERHKSQDIRWGMGDKQLFEIFFKTPIVKESPSLAVFLTLTIHSPYNMCSANYYDTAYLSKRLKEQQTDTKKVSGINSKLVSSILYTDDALKYFFMEFKKRPDFKNTIFIITGDHACLGIDYKYAIQRLNVPLIIYSPLLEKYQHFKSISTHRDIIPTLLALLHGNFNVEIPQKQHWTGIGLDTCQQFRCRNVDALSIFITNYPTFINNGYLSYNNSVFKITDSLDMIKISDMEKIKQLSEIEFEYKILNNYVCKHNKLWYKD